MPCMNINIRSWTNKKDKNFENIILALPESWSFYSAHKSYEYSRKILEGRWKKGEETILQSPYYSYLYAKNVIKGRWKDAEEIIKGNGQSAYLYSRYVLKSRWEETEKTISNDIHWSYLYARYVLKSRFKLAESKIKNHKDEYWYRTEDLCRYAIYVVKDRFEKIENRVLNSSWIEAYMKVLNPSDKEEFYNKVLIEAMKEMKPYEHNYAKSYIQKLNV